MHLGSEMALQSRWGHSILTGTQVTQKREAGTSGVYAKVGM